MAIGHCALGKLFPLIQEIVCCLFMIYYMHILFANYCYSFLESVDEARADGWVISSESCGFLSIGARYVREVNDIVPK